jgi:CAAX prenyl protease-like protein
LPFLTMVAVMMITTAFSAIGFDWLYPVKVAATLAVLGYFASTYKSRGDLAWSWSWWPVAIGVVVFVLWRALEPLAGVDASASEEQRRALSSVSPLVAGIWLAFRAIGSIVAVPLAEELAFRGYLTRQMINEDFESVPIGKLTWFSFVGGSLIFGLLHGRWFAGTIAGMLFAGAAWRRGRMMDAVVAHATANALVTAYALSTGDLAAWS